MAVVSSSSSESRYEVHVIQEGYSYSMADTCSTCPTIASSRANGTCTLIKCITSSSTSSSSSSCNVLVDTLSPWDSSKITEGLAEHSLTCADLQHVVCTHGHVDHVGNLNLFCGKDTKIIVGYAIVSKGDHYCEHPFDQGIPYRINDDIMVIATPGHTATDVSVIVRSVKDYGTVAIVGDLFEREDDIQDPSLWCDEAGSENPSLQRKSRSRVLHMVDYVVPGHGKMFKVTDAMRQTLDLQMLEDLRQEDEKSLIAN